MKKEFVFRVVLALGIFFLVYQFGIKPVVGDKLLKASVTSSDTPAEWVKDFVATKGKGYDVVVYGEDPDGIAAAISAARLGAKTLLLAKGKDLGGVVTHSMLTDLELPYGKGGKLLNGGILSQFYKGLGKQFSPSGYQEYVSNLISREKNIEVGYDTVLKAPLVKGSWLNGLVIEAGGARSTVKGRFFIDATSEGDLLKALKVPFKTASEDLNMGDTFMPASLNFMMEGTDSSKIKELVEKHKGGFYEGMGEYHPLSGDVRLDGLEVSFPEKNRIVIQGLRTQNFDPDDIQKAQRIYREAADEAKNLADFLAGKFTEFKGWKFSKAADGLFVRESFHYQGLYTLTVSDLLENRYFDNTVAMGSYPVDADKFAEKGVYLTGKPTQYGIPIGSLIPAATENLLMTGSKASYSSLAASSAGTLGTGIATGEVSGVTAVYCLAKQVTPSDIEEDRQLGMVEDIRSLLEKERGFYLPNEKISNKNYSNWSYPALRQLLSLGLVAGGSSNDYRFDMKASQKDLAVILLNGVYRLDKGAYDLGLDARIRPYFNGQPLTRDKAAEMLAVFYDLSDPGKDPYAKVSAEGYINDMMQLRLKDKKILTMDDVYYLGAYNIKMYTGRDIQE